MAIIINIDVMLAKRKVSVTELAEKVGITMANISVLKQGNTMVRWLLIEAAPGAQGDRTVNTLLKERFVGRGAGGSAFEGARPFGFKGRVLDFALNRLKVLTNSAPGFSEGFLTSFGMTAFETPPLTASLPVRKC